MYREIRGGQVVVPIWNLLVKVKISGSKLSSPLVKREPA